jgi:hypothetical protein
MKNRNWAKIYIYFNDDWRNLYKFLKVVELFVKAEFLKSDFDTNVNKTNGKEK